MRRPGAKIPDESFLAVQFGPQLQDLLFPHQIHRQRARDEERDFSRLLGPGVLGIVLKDEGVAGFVEFDEFAAQRRIWRHVTVFKVVHLSLGERILVEELKYAEWLAAHCQNIHCFVVIALNDLDDLRGAAYPNNTLGKRQQNAKLGFFLQATIEHLQIARLEDVQGKVCAGEKNDVQGEERYPFRPHSSKSNDTRRERFVIAES